MNNTHQQEHSEKPTYSGPIAYMADKPVAVNLLMMLLLLGGVWTMFNIQKEVYPEFQLDVVEVSVVYPGASPAEVEQGIIRPVEEAVRGVQGIREITSTANEGSGDISIELVSGTERMRAFQDIDQAVNRIQTFPDNIEEPEVVLQTNQQEVIEIGLFGNADLWSLRKLAERLRDELLNDPAITQVEIGNVPNFVTHIEIPQYNLRKYDITLQQIADIVAESSEDVPAGALEAKSGEVLLRMKERKQWADELAEIDVVATDSGGTVQLGRLATITDGFEETGFHGQFNQQPSVELQIYRIGDQSPLEIAPAVIDIMETAKANFPPGVDYRIDSNSAEDFEERLSLLTENGLMAILIVIFILAVFLEYRLAFWVMMGMTISFVGGILFLPLFGLSINMISMFGFLVVLGIVVDDAIVVGENVYEYRQKGMNFLEAAIAGTKDISKPVIISILTNIIAFIPLLLLPGETGKYWWPLPAVVIVVLALSLFEALFILPAHLAHSSKENRFRIFEIIEKWQKAFEVRFKNFINHYYSKFLDISLKNRYITMSAATALLLVIGAYGYSDHMGMVLMPEVSADEIEAGVSLPVGTTVYQAGRVAERITDATDKMFEEHNLFEQAEGIKTNVRGQNFIDVEIVLKAPGERTMRAREIIELWRDNIGDIEGVDQITFEAERGPAGFRQDISVDLSHSDIEVLEEASNAFVERVESYDNTRDVNDNYNRGKSQFNIKLLPEGRRLGFTSDYIGQQVRNAFFGALSKRQLRGTNEVEVRVKLPREDRRNPYNFENMVLMTPNGTEVPLMDVARIDTAEAFTSINRRNGRRIVSVGMDAEPSNAVNRVLESLQQEELPQLKAQFPGLTWSFEGSQSELRESAATLWGSFGLALIAIYALLAVALNSYIQPFIIMGAIPFGIVGAVIGHILLGYDLSLVSLMGVIALSGVLLNDSLIMVDYANKQRKTKTAFEAIHKAGLRRFRPIMLTTLTTFGGLTPIILETSRQAYNLIPMAISLGFGIVFATSIILVIVPSIYMIFEDLMALGSKG